MIKLILSMTCAIVASCFCKSNNKESLVILLPDPVKVQAELTKSRLSFSQTTFDFGQVPRKTKLHYAFKYGVSSLDTVKIIRNISSCSCTFAKVPTKPLNPGDTGAVEVTYTTGITEGPFEKSFTIYTNSESTPEIELVLKGTVMRCVWTDLPALTLDEAQLDAGWKKDIKIVWQRWSKPGFKKLTKVPSFMNAGSFTQDPCDSTVWHLPVSLSSSAEAKYYQDTVVITTSDTSWPKIIIPIQGTIADVAVPKPLVVNMGQVKIGQQVSNSFVVVSSVQGSKVEKVQSSTGKIKAEIGNVDDNEKVTRINLSTSVNAELGSIGTDILVVVNVNGRRKELKVPVVGRFEK